MTQIFFLGEEIGLLFYPTLCYGFTAEFLKHSVFPFSLSCNIFVMFLPLFFFRQPPPPFVRETEPEPEPAPTPTPSPRAATEEPEDTADLRNKVQKLEEEVQQVRCHWEMSWDIRLYLVTLMLA